ncbi:hypothetical protein XHV734_3093 [Xanthomonas hortorum pv. vitians]|nr:hypothetical protein XHV734_3093 [Xanthomonas hortorum pv. vitians]
MIASPKPSRSTRTHRMYPQQSRSCAHDCADVDRDVLPSEDATLVHQHFRQHAYRLPTRACVIAYHIVSKRRVVSDEPWGGRLSYRPEHVRRQGAGTRR